VAVALGHAAIVLIGTWERSLRSLPDVEVFCWAPTRRRENLARELCARCAVRPECLDLALRTDSAGYWAGTTYGDRDLVRNDDGSWLIAKRVLTNDWERLTPVDAL